MFDTFSKVPINIPTPSRISNTKESNFLCWSFLFFAICKNPEDGLNFLEVHWLESESSDGAVQVSEVIHLEYIKPLPPFVILDAEDAFDFAPTSIFFRISFENGYITLYADSSAFGIEIGEH